MPTQTNPTTTCTGMVRSMTTHEDVPTDSHPGRNVTVHVTRCTDCAGSATVEDAQTGEGWVLQLPADYRHDADAAYWAAEQSMWVPPTRRPERNAEMELLGGYDPTTEPWSMDTRTADANAQALATARSLDGPIEDEPIEDEDGSLAYARMLERRAESGSWFGSDPF